MIRLIGVLSEGGVPVVIKTYVETEGEMIIGALISAAKTLCDAMGSGEVRKLAFKDNTMIVTETKKCYTVVALVDSAEDYMDSLLRIIAEEIDESDIPKADGTVNDEHIILVTTVLDTYIKDKIESSLSDIVKLVWPPIQDAIDNDTNLKEAIHLLEQKLDAANLEPDWNAMKVRTESSLENALQYALDGEYDRACAASIDLDFDAGRVFAIKMGQLARSMTNTSAPSVEEIRTIAATIKTDEPFSELGRKISGFLSGNIPGSEYTEALKIAAEAFQFGDTQTDLLYSFLFMGTRISLIPDFSKALVEYLKGRSDIARAYVFSIIDRDAIFDKLYSVSNYDDFKDTMGFYKGRIESILEQIRSVLKKGFVERIRRVEGAKDLALQGSLQLQNYITLLTALAESPVLTISERKEVLEEVLQLYWDYFRRLLTSDFPLFAHTIDSVFQSLGVACAEYYYLSTGKEREEHLLKVGEFLVDIIEVTSNEWGKSAVRFSNSVVTNALGSILTRDRAFRDEEVLLVHLEMKSLDLEANERIRETAPFAYATNMGNILTTLASVAHSLLSPDIRKSIFSECVLRSLEVQEWFVAHGVVCRDDIVATTFNASFAADMFSENDLRNTVKIVTALNRVAIQDPQKYDYEVAMTATPLIGILTKSWERLGNPRYHEQAVEILRMSADAWRKYGFYEKAENLENLFSQLRS
ncbi:MAG: hypothetical protein ACW98Y_01805 [Candidatus Thorarchaeota archaeon]|jgi:hypothetical protein